MRLFIAVDATKEIKECLRAVSNDMSKYIIGGAIKHHHITLKFLGDVDERKVDDIVNQLNKVKFKSFNVTVSNLGVFNNLNYVRIIWAGIDEGHNDLIGLNKKINYCLTKFNFKDDFKYHPHITLFRARNIVEKNELIKRLNSIKLNLSFEVNKFTLYKSELKSDGPVYETLAEFSS